MTDIWLVVHAYSGWQEPGIQHLVSSPFLIFHFPSFRALDLPPSSPPWFFPVSEIVKDPTPSDSSTISMPSPPSSAYPEPVEPVAVSKGCRH